MKKSLAALLGAVMTVGVFALVTAPATGQVGDGYVLSNVGIASVDEEGRAIPSGTARVTYDFVWGDDDFPGERACVWRVYDSSGSEIGAVAATLTGLDRANEGVWQDVPVSGTPHSATAICSGERLDDPRGRYLSNVERVHRGGGRSLELVFGARWEGAGDPQPQKCVVTVTDSAGAVVAEDDFVLYAQSPIARGRQLIAAEADNGAQPSSAEMSCGPLS